MESKRAKLRQLQSEAAELGLEITELKAEKEKLKAVMSIGEIEEELARLKREVCAALFLVEAAARKLRHRFAGERHRG